MPIQYAIHQKYGTDEGRSTQDGGMYCGYGPEQVYELILDLTELDETEAVQNDVLIIPDNCMITRVKTVCLVAAADGTAIDVGLLHISRDTSDSEFTADPNGLLAAFTTASMDTPGQTIEFFASGTANTEESLPASVTLGGDLIGDVNVAPCVITASRTTATAFTAGKLALYIHCIPNALSS